MRRASRRRSSHESVASAHSDAGCGDIGRLLIDGPDSRRSADAGLEGTSWRLVQISMSDGATRPAIERSRYTIGFGTNGVLNVRFDCNRGRGSWKSSAPGNSSSARWP